MQSGVNDFRHGQFINQVVALATGTPHGGSNCLPDVVRWESPRHRLVGQKGGIGMTTTSTTLPRVAREGSSRCSSSTSIRSAMLPS